MRQIAWIVMAALLPGFALAADGSNTKWARQPGEFEYKTYWPSTALDINNAKVELKCLVVEDGSLKACEVVSETPAEKGFGRTAIFLSRFYGLKPGELAGQSIAVPVTFHKPSAIDSDRLEWRASNPRWTRTPNWAEMQAAYPPKAKAPVGEAGLSCRLSADTHPEKCTVLYENPRGQGFGQAAQSLAPLFALENVDTAKLTVEIPFKFVRGKVPPPLLKPKWSRLIGVDEARQLYPLTAKAAGALKGEARLQCRLSTEGELILCNLLSETPAGLGFGQAGLETAKHMAVHPWSDGFPVEGTTLTFPVRFTGQ